MVRYEQNDPSVNYTGAWFPNNGSFNSGGSAAMTMDTNSAAIFSFTGTGVKWIGFGDPWSGIAQVYVDGVLKATIDTFSANQASQTTQYSVANLSNASHTLKIVATGTHSSAASGAWIWVDAFDVTTDTGATSITGVFNAASYAAGPLTSNSYASLFGSNLTNGIGGTDTTVAITDAGGKRVQETLAYASAEQLNFLIPGGLAAGPGTVTVTTARQSTTIAVSVAGTAPGLFSADGSGRGAAAAQSVVVGANGNVTSPVARCGTDGCAAVTMPLAAGTSVYLVLYGTGVRGARNVTASIAGMQLPVAYAGIQGNDPGLDQINVLVPASLAGSGDVDVTVSGDGIVSNAVKVRF